MAAHTPHGHAESGRRRPWRRHSDEDSSASILDAVRARAAARQRAAEGEPGEPQTPEEAERRYKVGQFERAAEKEQVALDREKIANDRLRAEIDLMKAKGAIAEAPPPTAAPQDDPLARFKAAKEVKLAELRASNEILEWLEALRRELAPVIGENAADERIDELRQMVKIDPTSIFGDMAPGAQYGKR